MTVAPVAFAIDDQGPPCGHAGSGESCGLGERISSRRMGKCGRRRHHKLARVSIDAVAGNGREIGNGRRSFHPIWEKAEDDVISYLEFSHTVASFPQTQHRPTWGYGHRTPDWACSQLHSHEN